MTALGSGFISKVLTLVTTTAARINWQDRIQSVGFDRMQKMSVSNHFSGLVARRTREINQTD